MLKNSEKLIAQYLEAKQALKDLGILRTDRSLEGDYAEWLISNNLGLKLSESTIQKGYDATDISGNTYQIKSRVVETLNHNTSFDIKNIDFEFDYLVCVFFSPNLKLLKLLKIPYKVVVQLGIQNQSSFRLRWNKKTRSLLVQYLP